MLTILQLAQAAQDKSKENSGGSGSGGSESGGSAADKAANGAEKGKDAVELILGQLESWYTSFIENLPNLAVAIVFLVVAFFVSRWVNTGVQKLLNHRVPQKSIKRIAGKFAAVIVVLAGIFIALSVMNLDDLVSGIIAGAGISGLVVGLALQGTLSNTVSGVVLSFRKQVRIGDWVTTNGYEGEIVDIKLSTTVVKEPDNNLVIIPNKMVLENPMKNASLTDKMRIIIECGVGYETDLQHAKDVACKAISDAFEDVEKPEDVEFYYREFGDSSINFMLRFWYNAERGIERLTSTSKAIMAIKKAYDNEDINIPFPIRTLQFDNELTMNQPSKSKKKGNDKTQSSAEEE
ncbi:mechanosensitive ion channel family protein [Nonlabens ponticola]|uniref:Mechanosensitive ion channel family protein n=2 Tax=Nonlabens ponticola TaxID=2496866 RepID=A0A3S9N148_9FLAO|nr:mechanosensitive ion channel family protein [Nonlabens ponticola]AZQ45256.1 mechanosensitive ion channel family protein [Nonlabens ponticola]